VLTEIDLIMKKDGRATERLGLYFDTMKFMAQMCMMPPSGAITDSMMKADE
jgi:hypothetical protein